MMRELIRRILREEYFQPKVEEDIMNYTGKDRFIIYLKYRIRNGSYLTVDEIKRAEDFFEKNNLENEPENKIPEPEVETPEPEDSGLSRDEYLKRFKDELKLYTNEIKQEGIKTYLSITRGPKRFLFVNDRIKVGVPSDEWISQNIKDLNEFKTLLSPLPKGEFKFDNEKRTIEGQINLLLKRLEKKDFYGFLEKKGDKYVWSILNKTDTNYSNWIDLIYDAELRNVLGSQEVSTLSKIKTYFEQDSINFNDYEGEDREKMIFFVRNYGVRELSLADLDIINTFNYGNQESEEKSEKIFSNIKRTTDIGDEAEQKFIEYLESKGKPKSRIKSFSTPGNLVDITFQTDMLVFDDFEKRWFPVQVKSKDQYSGLFRFGFPGAIVVYNKKGKWYMKKAPTEYQSI